MSREDANHSLPRTGASRSARAVLSVRCWLADAGRSAIGGV